MISDLLSWLLYRLQGWLGWDTCPVCQGWHRIRFVKVTIYHPEEPPMFGFYQCTGCWAKTPVLPTGITEDAVRGLGFKDWDHFHERLKAKHKDKPHD